MKSSISTFSTWRANWFRSTPSGPKAADDATWPQDVAAVLDKAMKAASHGRPVHMGQEDQVKKTFHQLEVLGQPTGRISRAPGHRLDHRRHAERLPTQTSVQRRLGGLRALRAAPGGDAGARRGGGGSGFLQPGPDYRSDTDMGSMDHAWTPVQSTAQAPTNARMPWAIINSITCKAPKVETLAWIWPKWPCLPAAAPTSGRIFARY